jgi:hypothetical protein
VSKKIEAFSFLKMGWQFFCLTTTAGKNKQKKNVFFKDISPISKL